jgi:hypothetical protein
MITVSCVYKDQPLGGEGAKGVRLEAKSNL